MEHKVGGVPRTSLGVRAIPKALDLSPGNKAVPTILVTALRAYHNDLDGVIIKKLLESGSDVIEKGKRTMIIRRLVKKQGQR